MEVEMTDRGRTMSYKKLVRDKIPEIISRRGDKPIIQFLDADSYVVELRKKLQEEVSEYAQSGQAEELVDILEIIYSLASVEGISRSRLEGMRKEKWQERGGFSQKIYLVKVAKGGSRKRTKA